MTLSLPRAVGKVPGVTVGCSGEPEGGGEETGRNGERTGERGKGGRMRVEERGKEHKGSHAGGVGPNQN